MPDTKIWLLEKKIQETCLRHLTKSENSSKAIAKTVSFLFTSSLSFFLIQRGDRKSENLK